MTVQDIRGAGGGGGGGKGGGGSAYVPREDADNLFATSTAYLIDVISEGEIEGFADPAYPAKCIYFDDTPLQNPDGSYNFTGVKWWLRTGAPDQDPVPGFSAVESEVGVAVQVTTAAPVVRQISDPEIDAARVTVAVPALSALTDKGDLLQTSVVYAIDIKAGDAAWQQVVFTAITGKTTGGYQRAHRLDLPAVRPVSVRVRRITADSASAQVNDDLYFTSYTEIIDAKLSYPDTAYVALAVPASAFGGRVPRRSYRIKGLRIWVPSNYDPETGTYDESTIWDGTFQRAYSNNPAFFLYTVWRDNRWGLGDRIAPELIDKWAVYQIGKYCDGMVDDGRGGQERRFVIDGALTTRESAYDVITQLSATFRGMTYWGAGAVVPVQDAPADPVKLVTNANVIDGRFSYSGTAMAARKTAAVAAFRDTADHYRLKPAAVHEDVAGIQRYGRRQVDLSLPFETRHGGALRACRWEVETNLRATETVSYQAGFDHAAIRPGDVVFISDKHRLFLRAGGRLLGVADDRLSVTIDAPFTPEAGEAYSLMATTATGGFVTIETDPAPGTPVTELPLVEALPADVLPGAVFVLNASGIAPRRFRVLGNTPEGHLFNVLALVDDPGKFDRVEQGIVIEDPDPWLIPSRSVAAPPGSVSITTYLQPDPGSASKLRFQVDWTPSPAALVERYVVYFKEPGRARRYITETRELSVPIVPEGEAAGQYIATVYAVSAEGKLSGAATGTLDFTVTPYVTPENPTVIGAVSGFDTIELRMGAHPAPDFRAFRIYSGTAADPTPVFLAETAQAVYSRRPPFGDDVTRYKVTAITYGDLESDIGQAPWVAVVPQGVPLDGLQQGVIDAIDAASATAEQAREDVTAAVRLASQGMAGFPTFSAWPNPAGAPTGWIITPGATGSHTQETGTRYGQAVDLDTGAGAADSFPAIEARSNNAANLAVDPDRAGQVQLSVEVELISGGTWSGAYALVEWRSGSGNVSVPVWMADHLDPAVTGPQVVELFLDRPDTYLQGAPDYLRVMLFANSANPAGGGLADKVIRVHRLDLRAIDANSVAGLTAQALARQDGWAASMLALSATANGANGEIRVYALDDLTAPLSGISFNADYFTFQGNMALFQDTELRSDNWVDGESGWRIDRDGNSQFNDLAVTGRMLVPGAFLTIYEDYDSIIIAEEFVHRAIPGYNGGRSANYSTGWYAHDYDFPNVFDIGAEFSSGNFNADTVVDSEFSCTYAEMNSGDVMPSDDFLLTVKLRQADVGQYGTVDLFHSRMRCRAVGSVAGSAINLTSIGDRLGNFALGWQQARFSITIATNGDRRFSLGGVRLKARFLRG